MENVGPDGAIIGIKEASIASAATCNIGGVDFVRLAVTGTTPISSFGTVPNRTRMLRFVDSLVLMHNATSLVLPGNTSLIVRAGDTAVVVSDSVGNWKVTSYTRQSGKPIASEVIALSGVIENDGAALTTGVSTTLGPFYFDGVITEWMLLGDISGSVVVDIWKGQYADYPLSSTNSIITGGAAASTPVTTDNTLITSDTTLYTTDVSSSSGGAGGTITLSVDDTDITMDQSVITVDATVISSAALFTIDNDLISIDSALYTADETASPTASGGPFTIDNAVISIDSALYTADETDLPVVSGAKPFITSAYKGFSSDLTGWATTISSGDIIVLNVDSAVDVKRILASLKVLKLSA